MVFIKPTGYFNFTVHNITTGDGAVIRTTQTEMTDMKNKHAKY